MILLFINLLRKPYEYSGSKREFGPRPMVGNLSDYTYTNHHLPDSDIGIPSNILPELFRRICAASNCETRIARCEVRQGEEEIRRVNEVSMFSLVCVLFFQVLWRIKFKTALWQTDNCRCTFSCATEQFLGHKVVKKLCAPETLIRRKVCTEKIAKSKRY